MTLFTLSAREIKTRPGRAILTLLSTAIAIGAIVAVSLATDSTRRALNEMYESVTGRAALEVAAKAGGVFPQAIASEINRTPGVKEVVPVLQLPTVLYVGKQHRARLLAMGIDPKLDRDIRDYTLAQGEFFGERSDSVLLEIGFARSVGLKVGDKAKLLTREGMKEVSVAGLLDPRGIAAINQGGLVFMPLQTAQSFVRQYGRLSLVLDPSADEEKVLQDIAGRIPDDLAVRRPASRTRLARETMFSVEQGMTFSSVLMLVLAAFMILNTFLMNVNERRRQLAILRAIGATRPQVTRLVMAEGLVIGAAGTVLGVPLGLLSAHFLTKAMAAIFITKLPPVQIAMTPLFLAAVLGPGLAALATYVPARIAGAISPLEGLRPVVSDIRPRVPWVYLVTGLGIFAISGVVLWGCLGGWLPIGLIIPSGVAVIAGSVVLIAALLGPLTRLAAAIFSVVLRIEAPLAQRQLVRRRTRTTLTIGVLYIAVSTAIGLGTAIINNVNDVKTWYHRTMVGDFFVSAPFADPSTGMMVQVPESIEDQIGQIPGVESVGGIRFGNVRARKADAAPKEEVAPLYVVVVAAQFAKANHLPLELAEGDANEVYRRLLKGEIVVGTNLAQRTGLRVGDELLLQGEHGEKPMRIAATTISYTAGGLVVYMDQAFAERVLGLTGINVFIIQASSQALGEVEAKLRELCQQQGLAVSSLANLRRGLDAMIGGVVGGLWGLIALTFIVAALGIANTLTMNVLEQTREIAILRVVGMTQHQVRSTILSQALILGTISLATGMIGGIMTAYDISLCNLPLLGHPIPFFLPRNLLALSAVITFAMVLLAAWPPAQRAARLNLSQALQYE
jgi:putative ABC transport system permease protein